MTTAAEQAGISEKTVRRWIADGSITGYRVGARLIRVDPDDIAAMFKPMPSAADPAARAAHLSPEQRDRVASLLRNGAAGGEAA